MQNKDSLNCESFVLMMYDYFADDLTDDEKNSLLMHIEACPDCKREFAEIQAIMGAVHSIEDIEVPTSLKRTVFNNVEAEAEARRNRNSIYKFAVRTFVPVAACAVLAIGVFSGGIYDKIINSDDILTAEVNNAEVISEKTDLQEKPDANTDNKEITDSESRDISGKTETHAKKNEVKEQKPYEQEKSVKEEALNVVEGELPATEIIASGGGSSVAAEVKEKAEASNYKRSSVQSDEVAEEDSGINVAMIEVLTDTSETTGKLDDKSDIPVNCVVITENPIDFAAGFGVECIEADEISFEIPFDRWEELVNYNREYGAELNATYSHNASETITIIVKKPN